MFLVYFSYGDIPMSQYMLLALPRSGSGWLAAQLEKNLDLQYRWEYFSAYSPGGNKKYYGHEKHIKPLCGPTESWIEELDKLYQNTWLKEKENFNFTKEVWSAFKLPFFIRHFNCFVLYRSRKLTFPSSIPEWPAAYYHSACENFETLDDNLQQMIKVAKDFPNNINCVSMVGHTIAYYQLLMDAEQHNIPVINYTKLVTLPKGRLWTYMERKMQGVEVSDKLIDSVKQSAKKIDVTARLRNYDRSGLEAFYHKLIENVDYLPTIMEEDL